MGNSRDISQVVKRIVQGEGECLYRYRESHYSLSTRTLSRTAGHGIGDVPVRKEYILESKRIAVYGFVRDLLHITIGMVDTEKY